LTGEVERRSRRDSLIAALALAGLTVLMAMAAWVLV
jgi:hypothetical protein